MAPQLNNEVEKTKKVDEDARETISALTHRIRRSEKAESWSSYNQGEKEEEEEEEEEASIITLAGTNVGATMRGATDDKAAAAEEEEDSGASYAVNSNFQAVNNSVMLGGSFETNDPGVHLDITDHNDAIGRKGRRGPHRHAELPDDVTDADAHQD